MPQAFASEYRSLPAPPAGRPVMLHGLASVFNTLTPALVGYAEPLRERVARGAFSACLARRPHVLALWDHDPQRQLASTSDSLRLVERDTGLEFEFALPDSWLGREADAHLRAGGLRGCSFRFDGSTAQARIDLLPSGERVRTLTALDLVEISIISATRQPAYPTTSVRYAVGTIGHGPLADARRRSMLRRLPGPATPEADSQRRSRLASLERLVGL